MSIVKKIVKMFYYKLVSPNRFARYVGVKFGKNCNFKTKNFGSEAYLIEMGDNVRTARNVYFVNHDALSVVRLYDSKYKNSDNIGKIKIGSNVFLGLNVTILKDTQIGNNVIIGAGSVVRGEIKSNSIYAGVPAKFICTIDEYIEKNRDSFIETKYLSKDEKRRFLIKKFDCD